MSLTNIVRYAAVAGALAVPVAFAAPASATPTGTGSGSAYGISASGLVNITPTPSVETPGSKSLVRIPANPLLDVGVLNASASTGHARASVADLRLINGALIAHLVTARCDAGKGSSHLAKAELAGHPLAAADAAPNTGLKVSVAGVGLVSVTLNKQVGNPDGSLTVTALEVQIPSPGGKLQTVSVASATCSPGGSGSTSPTPTPPGGPTSVPTPPGTGNPPGGEAPKPTPVPSTLPVTG